MSAPITVSPLTAWRHFARCRKVLSDFQYSLLLMLASEPHRAFGYQDLQNAGIFPMSRNSGWYWLNHAQGLIHAGLITMTKRHTVQGGSTAQITSKGLRFLGYSSQS